MTPPARFGSLTGNPRWGLYQNEIFGKIKVQNLKESRLYPMSEEKFDHAYMHEHGVPHEHAHGHTHSHTQTRAVVNRLARAIGHLERVKAMVEEGRDCSEVHKAIEQFVK